MIQIQSLNFAYKNKPVFSDISLNFAPGNIYGLLGENGVGKTTLLKIISGLQNPQSGSCVVDGFISFDRDPQFLQNIAFLPDDVKLPFGATPHKYISQLGVFYPNYSEGSFLELMHEMNVDPEQKFSTMSFGQVKKSLICCTLSLGTRYILLDEPTNGLDIPSKADFRRILSKRINDDSAIIISTHQVKDVENLIDPIIIISNNDVLLNADIMTITQKLYFEYGGQQRPDSLYSEMLPGGYLNVVPNTSGEESQINIEALFNAVLRNASRIKELFS